MDPVIYLQKTQFNFWTRLVYSIELSRSTHLISGMKRSWVKQYFKCHYSFFVLISNIEQHRTKCDHHTVPELRLKNYFLGAGLLQQYHLQNTGDVSYSIPLVMSWLRSCTIPQLTHSEYAYLIPSCQGRQKDLKPALLQILSALRGLLTGTRRSWSVLIEPWVI